MNPDFYIYRAVVRRVIDGDTIRADVDLGFKIWSKDVYLRFAGIDTPEIRGEERPEGLVAKDRVIELIDGKEIYIRTQKDKTGKYGRWIADIYLPDGTYVNQLLLDEGLARPYM